MEALADVSAGWWLAIACAALVFAARALPHRRGTGRGRSGRPRGEDLAGREVVAIAFDFHEGQVSIDGVAWPARLDGNVSTPAPGDRLRVTAGDGRVVWVRPIAPDRRR